MAEQERQGLTIINKKFFVCTKVTLYDSACG